VPQTPTPPLLKLSHSELRTRLASTPSGFDAAGTLCSRTPLRLSGNGWRTLLFTLPLRCQRSSRGPHRDKRGSPRPSRLGAVRR
jgi:hypothetical protein